MILYYLILICLGLFIGRTIGYFMVKGTEYLVNKEYAKGTGYTVLTYILIGLSLFLCSPSTNATIVFSIIFVSIHLFVYVFIRNITKGVR